MSPKHTDSAKFGRALVLRMFGAQVLLKQRERERKREREERETMHFCVFLQSACM